MQGKCLSLYRDRKNAGRQDNAMRTAISVIALLVLFLWVWTARAERSSHYTPEYSLADIAPLLDGRPLTDADYELLFSQTGLARPGVEQLWEEGYGQGEDLKDSLLALQSRFFAKPEITCERGMFLVWSEWLAQEEGAVPSAMLASEAGGWPLEHMTPVRCFPAVQDGDILISFSSHIFGWRSGHAGIVVDEAKGLTLEAIAVGHDSEICSLESWAEYPSVALLRLKGASREERAQVAAFAEEYLVGIPYRVTSFTWSVPEMSCPEAFCAGEPSLSTVPSGYSPPLSFRIPAGTQCAHLVWTAYASFGYDLDGDGGFVVTPSDLFQSGLLEVVQIYGLDPGDIPTSPARR